MTRPSDTQVYSRIVWVVMSCCLLLFAAGIVLTSLEFRRKLRSEIIARDGETLHAITILLDESNSDDPLATLLRASRFKGVLAVRLFSADGIFQSAFPDYVSEGRVPGEVWESLRRLQAWSRFESSQSLSNYFRIQPSGSADRAPLLESYVPLHAREGTRLQGVAQFIMNAEPIRVQFARMDRSFLLFGILVFGVGAGLIVGLSSWSLRQLTQAHGRLIDQTQRLQRANEELLLVAKTSALGAVTAHLIHGLKNPLAGIHRVVSQRSTPTSETEWMLAEASARRMQSLINQVMQLLKEEEIDLKYEVPVGEMVDAVKKRIQPLVHQTRIAFIQELSPAVQTRALSNKQANLIAFILENVLENALQETKSGGTVRLLVREMGPAISFEVVDEGNGLSSIALQNLFAPTTSSKQGGGGIGLAICKQLANHLGAELRLKSSTTSGTVFELRLS